MSYCKTMNMEKQLKDYLHFYLGCECLFPKDVAFDEHIVKLTPQILDNFLNVDNGVFKNIKPILRPLSDMTEDEEEINNSLMEEVIIDQPYIKLKVDCGANIQWMLSKHFDIFGLIEAGLAIDATKLNLANVKNLKIK